MQIYPSIDIRNGKCVRLYQGDFAKETVYSENPLAIAELFALQGASWLHIVDLDAAKNPGQSQIDVIKKLITGVNLMVQIGGGIRQTSEIKSLLDVGANRVVIGSLAVTEPKIVEGYLKTFGNDSITVALDVCFKGGEAYVATCGWKNLSEIKLFDLLRYYEGACLKHLLCTDISRDGTLRGPNIALYTEISRLFPGIKLQASGGIADIGDLRELAKANISGAVLGRSLYEKTIDLSEALAC